MSPQAPRGSDAGNRIEETDSRSDYDQPCKADHQLVRLPKFTLPSANPRYGGSKIRSYRKPAMHLWRGNEKVLCDPETRRLDQRGGSQANGDYFRVPRRINQKLLCAAYTDLGVRYQSLWNRAVEKG